jgi:mercuric ion binding protein
MKITALSLSGLATMAALSGAQAAPQTTRLEVGELVCVACGSIAMDVIAMVESTEVTAARWTGDGTVAIFTVRYDDALTSPDAIAAAVTDRAGYPARALAE